MHAMKPRLLAVALGMSLLAACGDSPAETIASVVQRDRGMTATTAGPANPGVTPELPPTEPEQPTEPETPEPPTEPETPEPPVDPETPEVPEVPGGCESGLICVETLPYLDLRDTTLGTARFDRYACAPNTNESGPELVYRVEVPDDGLLVAQLDDMPPGVDVDVHILADLDPASCVDRGHTTAAAHVGAGAWYVVVDSWVDASGNAKAGAFSLTLGLTRAADFENDGLDGEVLDRALTAFDAAWQAGETDRLELTVIDFALHSSHPRLWTIDLRDGSLMFAERVSHGEGSAARDDPGYAERFSNIVDSHQSSLGLMRTAGRYMSASNGLSMRLDGLETGFNDKVRTRAIVIHSDAYASPDYVARNGRMGLSWGCPVIDPAKIDDFIGTIEGGSLVFSHYPDPAWLAGSTWLNAR
jgi:hypothetical protein